METPEWKKHEKHDKEANALMKELGFTDSKGQIRRWNGTSFWPKWEALGHSSVGFEGCSCKNAVGPVAG